MKLKMHSYTLWNKWNKEIRFECRRMRRIADDWFYIVFSKTEKFFICLRWCRTDSVYHHIIQFVLIYVVGIRMCRSHLSSLNDLHRDEDTTFLTKLYQIYFGDWSVSICTYAGNRFLNPFLAQQCRIIASGARISENVAGKCRKFLCAGNIKWRQTSLWRIAYYY